MNWNESEKDVRQKCDTGNALRHQLPPHVAQTLDCFEVQSIRPDVARFPWLSCVCQNRDVFSTCVFKFTHNGSSTFFKFLFATQNPSLAAFVSLTPHEVAVPHGEPVLQFHDASRSVWDHYFVPHWDQCVFSDQPFVESVSTVGVLRDVFTDRGGACHEG